MVLANIALTGSSGLLGRHISSVLLKNHFRVIASSRRKSPIKHTNLVWRKMDLNKKLNQKILDKTFGRVSAIIHAGAYVSGNSKMINKKSIKICNILATERLAHWAAKRNIHFVYISGAIVYKSKNKINSENSKILKASRNIYCNSKILSERKLLFYKKKGLKLTILRPSSIYGWGLHKSKIICKFINFSKRKKEINIYNPDKTNINLIHAYDVSDAVLKSIKKGAKGIFNLGSSELSNFYQVATLSNKIFKNKKKIKILKKNKISSINMLHVNIKKAKKILNWRPNFFLYHGLSLMVKNKCF